MERVTLAGVERGEAPDTGTAKAHPGALVPGETVARRVRASVVGTRVGSFQSAGGAPYRWRTIGDANKGRGAAVAGFHEGRGRKVPARPLRFRYSQSA